MSTRCQILFKENRELIKIYRHSDGYPEGIVPDMEKFLKWNEGRNNDLEYMAANFIYFMKRFSVEEINLLYKSWAKRKPKYKKDIITDENWRKNFETYNSQLTGYGITTNKSRIHGDENYFYRVEIKKRAETAKYWLKSNLVLTGWEVDNETHVREIIRKEPILEYEYDSKYQKFFDKEGNMPIKSI